MRQSLSISDTTSHLPKMSSQRKKGRSCIWGAMRAQLKRKGLARPCITNASLVSLIFLNARRRESSGDRCFNARCADDDCDLACAWVFFCSFCPWPSRALSSLLLQVHQREKSGSNLWWPSIGGGAARDREWHYFSRFLTLKHTYLLCQKVNCNH